MGDIPGEDVARARRHINSWPHGIYIRAFGSLISSAATEMAPRRPLTSAGYEHCSVSLVVHSRQVLSRRRSLDLLWPEAGSRAAVNSLNQSVSQLRRVLNPEHRDGETPQYLISTADSPAEPGSCSDSDLDDFGLMRADAQASALRRARRTCRGNGRSCPRRIPGLISNTRNGCSSIEICIHAEVRDALLPLASREAVIHRILSVRAAQRADTSRRI